jgi:hypothetical protein
MRPDDACAWTDSLDNRSTAADDLFWLSWRSSPCMHRDPMAYCCDSLGSGMLLMREAEVSTLDATDSSKRCRIFAPRISDDRVREPVFDMA